MKKLKIFVAYYRVDAGDFAENIQRLFASFEQYDVFTDVNSIEGDIWTSTIEDNISNCDIFVVIITQGALQNLRVEREVLQAQREKKRIIPCFHENVSRSDIKWEWELDEIQGFEFSDKYDLIRKLNDALIRFRYKKM